MRNLSSLHIIRTVALGAALALGTVGLAAAPSSAMVLGTTTTVTTSGSPALVGTDVTFTATVTLTGLNLNLGPLTPTGTVTFTVDGEALPPVPLSQCVVLVSACTASVTVPAPDTGGDSWAVSARYDGDALARPSTAALAPEQEFVGSTTCETEQTCSSFLTASDGSAHARVEVDAEPSPPDQTYQLLLGASSTPLSCTRPNTGSGFYLDTEGAAAEGLRKTFTYLTFGPAAVAASSDVTRVCWQADQPFTTRDGTPAAPVGDMFEGLLPGCAYPDGHTHGDGQGHDDHGNGEGNGHDGDLVPANAPCVDESWYDPNWDGAGPRLQTLILTPAGDPRASR